MSAALDRAINKAKEGTLRIRVGERVVQNGELIPKAETHAVPTLSLAASTGLTSNRYLIVSLDLDGPFPSFSICSPILHWLQSDIVPSTGENSGSVSLNTSGTPPAANWVAAGPPPISGPHRYVFVLYEQPKGFDYKAFAPPNGRDMGVLPRIRFNLDDFEKKAGLGEIVGGGMFLSK